MGGRVADIAVESWVMGVRSSALLKIRPFTRCYRALVTCL